MKLLGSHNMCIFLHYFIYCWDMLELCRWAFDKKTAVTDSVCNISFFVCLFFAGSQRKAWLSATNRIFWYQVSYVFPQHRLGSGKNNYFCLYIFKRNTFCSFFLTCSNRISSSNQEVFQFGKCKTIFISLGDVR